jgi:integrase
VIAEGPLLKLNAKVPMEDARLALGQDRHGRIIGMDVANDGHDTRALQHYLGHKNIQHTVRYTELSPDRFRDFWRD